MQGVIGSKMRDEILRKIEKWQEPPPAKIIKPLKAPDAEAKKRRGGKRLRKMKERYGLTDMRKAANRINFNQVSVVCIMFVTLNQLSVQLDPIFVFLFFALALSLRSISYVICII